MLRPQPGSRRVVLGSPSPLGRGVGVREKCAPHPNPSPKGRGALPDGSTLMRWNALAVLGVLALAIMAGCKEQCFVHDCDLEQYSRLTGVPDLECKPGATILPSGTCTPAPATVLQPERPSRYITLAEAFALALERGTPGNPLLNGTTADAL